MQISIKCLISLLALQVVHTTMSSEVRHSGLPSDQNIHDLADEQDGSVYYTKTTLVNLRDNDGSGRLLPEEITFLKASWMDAYNHAYNRALTEINPSGTPPPGLEPTALVLVDTNHGASAATMSTAEGDSASGGGRNLRRRGRRIRDLFSDWIAIFGHVDDRDCNMCKQDDDYYPYPTTRGLDLLEDQDDETSVLLRTTFERELLDLLKRGPLERFHEIQAVYLDLVTDEENEKE